MNFKTLTANRRALRERVSGMSKTAGWISKAITYPIRKPAKALGKGFLKGTWAATKRTSGPGIGKALAPLMYGAGLVGTGAMAVHGYNKYKQYKQGFDPRLQQLQGRYPGNR